MVRQEDYVLKQFEIAFKYSVPERGEVYTVVQTFEIDCRKRICLDLCFVSVGKKKQKAYHTWHSVRECRPFQGSGLFL